MKQYKALLICALFTPVLCKDSILQNLADALSALERQHQPVTGRWIVKEYPQALVGYDTNNHIYHFKVLNQSGTECGFHTYRNLAFILNLLESGPAQFPKIYQQMLNPNSYKSYLKAANPEKSTACWTILLKSTMETIKKQQPTGLPIISENYLPIRFIYNKNQSQDTIKDFLSLYETKPTEQAITNTTALNGISDNFDYFINQALLWANNKPCTIAFDLSDGVHATALIAKNNNNKTEFFFADSLSGTTSIPAQRAINLLNNKQHLLDSLLRTIFYRFVKSGFRDINYARITSESKQKRKDALEKWDKLVAKTDLASTTLYKQYYGPAVEKLKNDYPIT